MIVIVSFLEVFYFFSFDFVHWFYKVAIVEDDKALIHLLSKVLILIIEQVPSLLSDCVCHQGGVGTIVEINSTIIGNRKPTDAGSISKL